MQVTAEAQQKSGRAQSQLMQMVIAPVHWTLIEMALKLKLFDSLAERKSAEEVAEAFVLDLEKTRVLLDALCSIELLSKNAEGYQLVSQWAPYLSSNSVRSMRNTLLHLAKVKHASADSLIETLRTGTNQHVSRDFSRPEFWDQAMANLYGFHQSVSNDYCLTLLGRFSQFLGSGKRILDVGAGSEILMLSVSDAFPGTQVCVFDLPNMASRIAERVGDNHQDFSVIPGDYNVDGFGGPYDLIWSSMSLYYAKDLVAVLKKIRAALGPKGVFMSFHEGLFQSKTRPPYHVVGRFVPAINGSDYSFERGEIAEAMRRAGFSRVESETKTTPFGQMDLDLAYNV